MSSLLLICHPGRPSEARSIRDPEADQFYSWVPDQVRDDKRKIVWLRVRDDSVLFVILKPQAFLICHPGRPSGARSIRDPGANPNLFCLWVPDTVRLATLAHSSGTTVL